MNDFYRETLVENNIEHYIFGHIGEHHLHVNMVPRSESELLKAKELYELFAKKIVSLNGAVSAEHGIGKLKKPFLRLQHSPDVIDSMRKMKKFFDPNWILNPGVLFDRE
jgi:FAD/FMN-containing dehydrogenase